MHAATHFQPVQAHERIQLVDALRGFALFGILIVNMWSFSRYEWLPSEQRSESWLAETLRILIDTKFLTIFSILFGAGFHTQQARASATGVLFGKFYTKRMLILFLIGAVHAYLLWFGDIIRHYALLGLALLLVGRLSAKSTLILAIIFITVLTPTTFIVSSVMAIHTNPDEVNGIPLSTYIFGAFTKGSYQEILEANWLIDPLHNFAQDMPIALVSMFGRMLLGVWLDKIGFFRNPAAFSGLVRSWLWIGGPFGVASSIGFWAINKGWLSTDNLYMLPVIFLVSGGLVAHSLFYMALFAKCYTGWLGKYLLRFLAPVGRMGLTNYLAQTVLAFGVLYATGWVGQLSILTMLWLSFGIFIIQVGISRWWLGSHHFGPVEWVWRQLSYHQ